MQGDACTLEGLLTGEAGCSPHAAPARTSPHCSVPACSPPGRRPLNAAARQRFACLRRGGQVKGMDGGRSRKNERPSTPPHAETAFPSAQPNHVSKALIAASGNGRGQCLMRGSRSLRQSTRRCLHTSVHHNLELTKEKGWCKDNGVGYRARSISGGTTWRSSAPPASALST
jgi:hypothetical protein